MKDLITASEAALRELKDYHCTHRQCYGPKDCPTAAAIANLEFEITKAKQTFEESKPIERKPPMEPKDEMIFKAWNELHAVLDFEVPIPDSQWWGAARPMLVKADAILTQLIEGIENLPPIAYMPIDPST